MHILIIRLTGNRALASADGFSRSQVVSGARRVGRCAAVFEKDPGELAWVVPGSDVVAVFPEI